LASEEDVGCVKNASLDLVGVVGCCLEEEEDDVPVAAVEGDLPFLPRFATSCSALVVLAVGSFKFGFGCCSFFCCVTGTEGFSCGNPGTEDCCPTGETGLAGRFPYK
jgi:hypothetical protein